MKSLIVDLLKEVAPVVATAITAAVIRHVEKCKIKNHYRARIAGLLKDIRDAREKRY